MSKQLRKIYGIPVQTVDLELVKVGDLVYFDGPIMSVYKNKVNTPYIFDWVESDEFCNRWMVYEVEKEALNDYVFGKISHFSLINGIKKDLVYILDKDSKGNFSKNQVISLKNIPNEYLPKSSVFFDKEEASELESIIENFGLTNELKTQNEFKKFNIVDEAIKNDTEMINLHIKSDSSKVGYGKIRSSILGEILTGYSKLTEATAISLFDYKSKLSNDEKPRRRKGELGSIKELGETEFVYAKAASFSVFLKPIKQKLDLFDELTSSELINKTIFELFSASENSSELKKIEDKINDGMLTSYNSLLKEIKEQDLTLLVQYANPKSGNSYEETFDSKKAISILKNLAALEIDKSDDVKAKGVFKALDSLNCTFKFETTDNEIFVGKFSDMIKQGIYHYNLIDSYNVVFEILTSKKSGKTNATEKVTMVSCIKID